MLEFFDFSSNYSDLMTQGCNILIFLYEIGKIHLFLIISKHFTLAIVSLNFMCFSLLPSGLNQCYH